MRIRLLLVLSATALVLTGGDALGKGGVFSSPHNLSASGGLGKHAVALSDETRVCAFCHVPHNASQPQLLWSRELPSDASYTPYGSTTLKTLPTPDRPTGASRLCLSCHDGTIALGQFVGSRVAGGGAMPSDPDPTANANLTGDLSDDHPISFAYTEAVAAEAELVSPGALPPEVRLDRNGELQCTACHDPHDNEFGNFLVIDNRLSGSPLCAACHDKTGWSLAAHNPLQTATLSAGCMNCHYAHSAPEPMRLLRSPNEEENCYLNCHNAGDPDSADIRTVISTVYSHPVDLATGIHDPVETLPATDVHVECVDCHNAHQATGDGMPLAAPPAVNGPLLGVRIDTAGTVATTEHDICFKCHAGANATSFQGTVAPRLLVEADEQNRFDGVNPSYHPVTANRNGSGASLKLALQASMLRIYCSDCHNSEQSTRAGGDGADGPHGSIYPHILMAQYEMPLASDPPAAYSASLYALCFRCHEETFVMGIGTTFAKGGLNMHVEHVQTRRVPCFACHDPHGVALTAGATITGNAHLVNFDADYTTSPLVPVPAYQTLAPASGSCTVSCHGNLDHTRDYAP